jgi:hypothetical protein
MAEPVVISIGFLLIMLLICVAIVVCDRGRNKRIKERKNAIYNTMSKR